MKIKDKAIYTIKGIRFMFRLEKTYTVLLIITTILRQLIPYISIYLSALIIDELVNNTNTKRLFTLVAITIISSFVLYLALRILERIKDYHFRIFSNERVEHSKKMMSLDYEDLEDAELKKQMERISIESQTGFNLFYLKNSITGLLNGTTNILASAALLSSLFMTEGISVILKMVFILFIFLNVVTNILTNLAKLKVFSKISQKAPSLNKFVEYLSSYYDDYNNGKDCRIYAMGGYISRFNRGLVKEFNKMMVDVSISQMRIDIVREAISGILRLGTYFFVIYACYLGTISIGSIAKYVACIALFMTGMSTVLENVLLSGLNAEYLKRYFSFFEREQKMYKGTLSVEKRDDNEYEIRFVNVSFKYPKTDVYVLKNLNLDFKVGSKLAVVGMNGSGKTTMIKLLCRLYDPTEGEILLNGIDIRKYDYDEYMQLFSVVFQDFGLLAFSLGVNVAANSEYDAKRVMNAIEKAGLKERFQTMSKGFETNLYKNFDEQGIEISGGEAQKIAIARAVYKDSPFIILDEPTASLDPVAEYEIYSSFNELVGNKTAIYISHRLSSCRFCDDIAVFHEGMIVQRGCHDELVKDTSNKYYELWHSQAQYYE
jgi:ATP-binding cassette subfamily B protein